MGKQRFRQRSRQAPRYPRKRELIAGLGALLGAGALAACDLVPTTEGEAVMPDDAGQFDAAVLDAGALAGEPELPDAGAPDSGEPDAGMLAGEPELPDGGLP